MGTMVWDLWLGMALVWGRICGWLYITRLTPSHSGLPAARLDACCLARGVSGGSIAGLITTSSSVRPAALQAAPLCPDRHPLHAANRQEHKR